MIAYQFPIPDYVWFNSAILVALFALFGIGFVLIFEGDFDWRAVFGGILVAYAFCVIMGWFIVGVDPGNSKAERRVCERLAQVVEDPDDLPEKCR